jgi:hypothetical protein
MLTFVNRNSFLLRKNLRCRERERAVVRRNSSRLPSPYGQINRRTIKRQKADYIVFHFSFGKSRATCSRTRHLGYWKVVRMDEAVIRV